MDCAKRVKGYSLIMTILLLGHKAVHCLNGCSREFAAKALNYMDCAAKCNNQDFCQKFMFEDNKCSMQYVTQQTVKNQPWMVLATRNDGNPSMMSYQHQTRLPDLTEYFKNRSSALGFDKRVDFSVGSKQFSKYYKVVNNEAKALQHWQTQRGCLQNHGILPVVDSVTEAMQLAQKLFPGSDKIPLGFEYNAKEERVYWLDGFTQDNTCYDISNGQRYGVFDGKAFFEFY